MNAQDIIKKIKLHRKINILWLIIELIAIIISFDFVNGIIGEIDMGIIGTSILVILILGIFVLFGINTMRTELLLQNILFKECNPQLFYEVMKGIQRTSPQYNQANKLFEITANFFLGNYENVVFTIQNGSSFFNNKNLEMMSYYIQAQFLLNNYDGLQKGRSLIENLRNEPPKMQLLKDMTETLLALGDFSDAFLKKDYKSAYEFCASMIFRPKNSPALDLYYKYYLAISQNALGDIESSNRLYEHIVLSGGSLPIVALAKLQMQNK